jgi:predicted dehydrogenase
MAARSARCNLKKVVELAVVAREKGCKTVAVLQARFAPGVTKIRGLLKEGRIGNVLSSTLSGLAITIPEWNLWV